MCVLWMLQYIHCQEFKLTHTALPLTRCPSWTHTRFCSSSAHSIRPFYWVMGIPLSSLQNCFPQYSPVSLKSACAVAALQLSCVLNIVAHSKQSSLDLLTSSVALACLLRVSKIILCPCPLLIFLPLTGKNVAEMLMNGLTEQRLQCISYWMLDDNCALNICQKWYKIYSLLVILQTVGTQEAFCHATSEKHV